MADFALKASLTDSKKKNEDGKGKGRQERAAGETESEEHRV